MFLFRFGGDLLSHVLRRSTIGATALNFRVREGIGCFARAIATKPEKKHTHQRVFSLLFLSIAFDLQLGFCALLLLDQIKPIEPLVPVN